MLRSKNKSVLSLLLALVMLVGVAAVVSVAFTPKAEAASAGNYNIRITYDVGDNNNSGTTTLYVWYKPNNGTGTEAQTSFSVDDINNNTGNNRTSTFTVSGFPTKMKLRLQQGGMRTQNATIKKGEIGSSSGTNYKTGWTGSVKVDPGWWGDKDSGELSLSSAPTPSATSTISTSADTVDMNVNGGSTKTVSCTFAISDLKDQYGVQWPSPTWSENSSYTSINNTSTASDSATLTVNATPNSTMAQQSVTITATSNGKSVATKTVTIRPTYKINFNAGNNGGTASSSVAMQTVVNNTNSANYANWTIPSGFSATKNGWTFLGWNGNEEAETGTKAGGTVTIDAVDDTLYAIFSKDLSVTYHYWDVNGGDATKKQTVTIYNKSTYKSVAAPAFTDQTNGVVPKTVVKDGVTYTFKGWRVDKAPDSATTEGTYTVYASAPDQNAYAVYSQTTKATFYTYKSDGTRTSKTNEKTVYVNCKAESSNPNPTTASVAFVAAPSNVTIDSRTFSFVGWRLDNTTTPAATETTVGQNKALALRDSAYLYYAVYSGDVTLSYNLNERYNDGTDAVTGTVPSNKTTQYAIADVNSAADAKRTTPAIAINPDNVQLTREGADEFLGWSFIENGADTESETANYPVTLAADAANALTIDTDTVLTAIFKDSRKTVKFLKPSGEEIETQTIRYNYDGTVPYIDPTEIAGQKDGTNHYYFNGWSQNNENTILVAGENNHYTFDRVKDHVNFTATYTGQSHTWLTDPLDAAEVTCNGLEGAAHAFVDGGYHRYCAVCEYGYNDTAGSYSPNTYVPIVAEEDGYVMVVNNRPPTCTAYGSSGKQQCKLCFKTLKEATPVEPLGVLNETTGRYGHDLQPVEAPAGANYTLVRCSVCGHEERYYISEAHTLVYRAATDATCTEEGYAVNHFYCTDEGCGKLFATVEATTELDPADVIIAALGHTWTETEGKAATCLETGLNAGFICSRCGVPQTEGMVIPAKGHPEDPARYETVEGVEATCTQPGREPYKKCLDCGTVIDGGEEIPAKGHKLSGIRVEMPTCTEGGRTYRVCENEGCDVDPAAEGAQAYEVPGDTLEAFGHDMRPVAGKAATCTEDGVKAYFECARCHRVTSDAVGETVIEDLDTYKVIPSPGHDLGDPEIHEPTCTEAGYSVRRCSRCTYTERTEGDAAFGHTGGTATCVSRAVCEVCGKPYGGYGTHVWDGGVLTTEPTCQTRAVTTFTCTVEGCGSTKIEKGGYGDHDYWVVSQTAPTCTAQGDTVKRCSYCGDETHEYTDALGHSVAEWTLEGSEAAGTCSRCGQRVTARPSEVGLTHICPKCGLVHEGRTGIFVEDGLYCKIMSFFRKIFSIFKG